MTNNWEIIDGDSSHTLKNIESGTVDCCISCPPFYGKNIRPNPGNCIGYEKTEEEYIETIVSIHSEVKRILVDGGTFWLVIGDGLGYKSGVPWKVAFALEKDGWLLQQEIIWDIHGPTNPCDEWSGPFKRSHHYILLFTKSNSFYFNRMPNKTSVWSEENKPLPTSMNYGYVTCPIEGIETCILAGSPEGGVVLDPFSGSGTTGLVALKNRRKYIGCELNPQWAELSRSRIREEYP